VQVWGQAAWRFAVSASYADHTCCLFSQGLLTKHCNALQRGIYKASKDAGGCVTSHDVQAHKSLHARHIPPHKAHVVLLPIFCQQQIAYFLRV